MKKDIIYIDIEDDITEIIGKIKAAKEKIIALVPPKRSGILQSAVNLRLLNRTAESAHKRLVLITANQALVSLAANVGIPVARNLQSKPELPQISAIEVDDGEDIIDGSSLPVGELEKTAEKSKDEAVNEVVDTIKIDDHSVDIKDPDAPKDDDKSKIKTPGVKVPNFGSFRKKLFLGVGAAILLTVFFVWATWFAPAAKIVITARTIPTTISTEATLGGNKDTDVKKGIIKTTTEQIKKETSVEFTPTGTDTVGDKAAGTVVFSNCHSKNQETVKAGTYLSSGGNNYVLKEDTVVAGGQDNGVTFDCVTPGTSSPAKVEAVEIGESYDTAPGATFSVSGYTSSMSATSEDGITGGTSKEVTVPSADDIKKATERLEELNEEEAKAELVTKFTNGEVVIDQSFIVDEGKPKSTPAEGEEAKSTTATLTKTTTYKLTAIARADIQLYLDAELDKYLETTANQRVYSDGIDEVELTNYTKDGKTVSIKIITSAQVGPSIDEAQVLAESKGKIYGDVQTNLEAIDGVVDVDVQFSYFWVTMVPDDDSKVRVEFIVEEEAQ